MDNSGCLQQSGRKTVGIKGDYAAADIPGQKYKLVATPGDQCDCQSACESFDFLRVDDTSSCYSLPASDSDSDSQSFRWVAESSCGNNTC
ncbi:hypothetical protein NUU61_008253 [Penicillium alfredii]|uniref:Uncharacterized protein n=1 Tax=Penicillium alfredii TaxID=1506179 RepID=A0A9W9ES44_9EURO|nr:uncharacterized protein NUU61_008253 [Penicillium alfredii]KAJ5086946.1 hypothetical protein NUU61_008253 [Penicillium alfredii]